MEKTSKSRSIGKNRPSSKKEIDLVLMFKAILRRLWVVALVTILAGAITFVGVKLFVTPTYRSSFTAYINNKKDVDMSAVTGSDVQASKSLAKTYGEIITGRTVLKGAAKSLDLNLSYSELKKMVSTSISNETEIITVSVVSTDPVLSFNLAEAVRDTSLKEVTNIIEGSSMKIIDHPEIPTGIYRPNYMRLTLFGALAGFFITILIICIRQYFNDKVLDENELEERYTIPVVGIIPDMINTDKGKGSYYYYYGHSDDKDKASEEKGEKE